MSAARTDGALAELPTDVAEFQSKAKEFIETTLPTLTPIPVTDTDRCEHVSLFTSRAAELAAVPTARQWRAAKFDAGFGWLTGPPEYGGTGLSEDYEHRYLDVELNYEVPPEDCFSTGLEGLGQTILAHGSDHLKELLLRRIFRGDLITCLLFSEPGAGSDLASVRTRAVRDGEDWVVNGQKVWSSRTHYADVGLLLARTGTEAERNRGITTFLVDIATPGLEVRPLVEMTGDAGFNEVFFDGGRIPDRRRLGEVGDPPPVEEHLVEAGVAGHLDQGAHLKPGGGDVDEERSDAAVSLGLGAGEREQQPDVGVVSPRRPHLLAVDDPVLAVADRPRPHRGQVGACAGLTEQQAGDQVPP